MARITVIYDPIEPPFKIIDFPTRVKVAVVDVANTIAEEDLKRNVDYIVAELMKNFHDVR